MATKQTPDDKIISEETIAAIAERIAAAVQKPDKGRPSNITALKIKTLLTVIMAGNYVEVACRYSRIGISTYYYWMARAEREKKRIEAAAMKGKSATPKPSETVYLELLEAIEQSTAYAEVSAVTAIRKAYTSATNAPAKDPRMALDFLKHRHRDRWHQKTELAGDPENPIASVHVYLPDNGRGPRIEQPKKGRKA